MLYSIDTGKYVTRVPNKADFDKWMKKLSDEDYQAIVDALNEKFDESGINTAGWLPGHVWSGTVFQPIFEACEFNVE